jgi:4-hydroxymandelate oxidase
MNVKEVRQEAKKRSNGICRVCRECNGEVCAGEFPGIGGVGSGASSINNYKALTALRVKMHVIHAAGDPETSMTLLGKKLSMPILAAVVASAKMNFREIVSEEGLAAAFITGARQAGTLAVTGDGFVWTFPWARGAQ